MTAESLQILTLAGSFFALTFLGVPISVAIGLGSFLTLLLSFGFHDAAFVVAPQLASGLQSSGLLAIPLFILAGNLMNRGGIARRLVAFASLLVGWMPGAMAHITVVANMLFGALSGSGVAAAAAVGGLMVPEQDKAGYDRTYCAAVNVSSCSTGLLIPPSGALIVYSLSSGGTSIAALFVAGYLPGLLMGFSVMLAATFVAVRHKYPRVTYPPFSRIVRIVLEAVPAALLVFVVMGGILSGIYTPTEASGVAVLLSLIAALIYGEFRLRDLPEVLRNSATTSSIVLFLVASSKAMAFVIAYSDVPFAVETAFRSLSENPVVLLLALNLVLLVVGAFMDMTPAILIFTPIFLPVAVGIGVDPVTFGIILVFNLSIGLCTPPVGAALFVGASISGVSIDKLTRSLIPFFLALVAALQFVTFVPNLSLMLPRLAGFIH